MERLDSGELSCDIVEVMACPGGCIMGGGQPADVYDVYKNRRERSAGIARADEGSGNRSPADNPLMEQIYENIVCGQAHELLHCERE